MGKSVGRCVVNTEGLSEIEDDDESRIVEDGLTSFMIIFEGNDAFI